MVIVTVEQCIKHLDENVKKKIIRKQDEMIEEGSIEDLSIRLENEDYRIKLLETCSALEKKHLQLFFRKYNAYLQSAIKEEQTTEEKLALLLLRQKGILYKVELNHKQTYVIPVEFIESYFENTFQPNYEEVTKDVFATKKYVYFLIELLQFINGKKVNSIADFQPLKEKVSETMNWSLLVSFLEEERLLEKKQGLFSLNQKNCSDFFREKNIDVKKKLTRFFIYSLIKDPFIANFFYWVIYRHCIKGSVSFNDLELYIQDRKSQLTTKADFLNVIKQLQLMEIISCPKNNIIVTSDELNGENNVGLENGILQFLLPVYIRNDAIWTFACWGNFHQWESMVEFVINKDTIENALRQGCEISTLIKNFQEYMPKNVVDDWEQVLQQWLDQVKPVQKKANLLFYSITEKLHRMYIEKNWPNWIDYSNRGLLIEKEKEATFEKLLKQISISIAEHDLNVEAPKKEHSIITVNEFPEINIAIPEIDNIPKQWFSMTSYEEKTMLRIVKQAIVLQLPLQIEKKNGEMIKLLSIKLMVQNGCYYIQTNKGEISFQEIKRLAIVHPLKDLYV